MAFWNRKKKRTTAKPKINASVPKPKVNSEKQESSIPPQPKKMDIPKPDKLPKNLRHKIGPRSFMVVLSRRKRKDR